METLFANIQIQTTTSCNRACDFCPKSAEIPLPEGGMRYALFERIAGNLGRLNFAGRVSPYMHAEPLLDLRLPEMIRLIRHECPCAYVMVNSNGDLLREDNLLALFGAGLNCLTVNCYDTTVQFEGRFEFVAELARRHRGFHVQAGGPTYEEYAPHPPDYHFVVVRDCTQYALGSEFLTSRAGDVRGKAVCVELPLNRPCSRPFKQMYINYRGEAVICCEDWRHQAIMGNVNDASLEDVWYGTEYQRYRTRLARADRSLPICRVCDFREAGTE